MNKIKIYLSFLLGIGLLLSYGCDNEEDLITDADARLEFSLDTLRFDTVFTELGSATRSFRIFNRNNGTIRITRAFIEGTTGARFRMNINGEPGNDLKELEIFANDSIHAFVEVTVDPDQPLSTSPFVIEDRIVFETNGNTQQVNLEAWGQNANYFPSRFNRGVPVVLSCNNGTIRWDDPKPYVIYGEVFIDSCALEVMAGTQIHVHGGIAQNDLFGVFNDGILWTLANGSIRFLGEKDNPVVIQGDRLEESFLDDAGQWQGIILGKGSKGNRFEYTTVKNAIFGVYVDSTAELTARNSQFFNTNSSGIIGFHSRITAENCLVYNNGSSSVLFLNGGDYNFDHCTIASYGVDASALSMSNFFCYDDPLRCEVLGIFRLNATFKNSIIFGSRSDEIQLSDVSGRETAGIFNVSFENCIVKVDDLLTDRDGLYSDFLENQCESCINGMRSDALFVDANEDDYHLDTLSIAIGQGQIIPGITIDLEDNPRDSEPDIGCYEYQK